MRAYPRSLVKGQGQRIRVNNETEEYNAGLEGYERHRDPAINEKEKGTDKEVLRVKPVVEYDEVDALIREQALADAKAEIKAEARAKAQALLDAEKTDEEKKAAEEAKKAEKKAATAKKRAATIAKKKAEKQ